jgi:alkane 1-monooxygenase
MNQINSINLKYWLILIPFVLCLATNFLFINSGIFNYRFWLVIIPVIFWVVTYIADFFAKGSWDKLSKDSKTSSNWILNVGFALFMVNLVAFGTMSKLISMLRINSIGGIGDLGDLISFIAVVIINGLCLGLGFSAIGHELIHRANPVHKKMGIAMLFVIGYSYHYIEHIQGHHKLVATDQDHSTAIINQSFWDYMWNNNLIGEFRTALKFEVDRFTKKNLPIYSYQNFVVRHSFLFICYLVLCLVVLGPLGFFSYLLAILIAKIFHTSIVYAQHYGLSRDLDDKIELTHSWQTNSIVTEYLVLGFGNHSEHHTKVTKTYMEINNQPNSPTLPFGYFASGLVALIPFQWFSRINPILKEFNKDSKE